MVDVYIFPYKLFANKISHHKLCFEIWICTYFTRQIKIIQVFLCVNMLWHVFFTVVQQYIHTSAHTTKLKKKTCDILGIAVMLF